MSGPIETHLSSQFAREFQLSGVPDAEIAILSAEPEDWRIRVTSGGRTFEAGYSHREQLWCREVTPGAEAPLWSNDEPRISASLAARAAAVQRIHRALRYPRVVFRDPPVI